MQYPYMAVSTSICETFLNPKRDIESAGSFHVLPRLQPWGYSYAHFEIPRSDCFIRPKIAFYRVNMLIESFHSGAPGQRRYCSLHRPATRLTRGIGVVLCPPLGHEYYRAYRAYVKLAQALSQAGFAVLRFDYLGTGDSDGEETHARLDDWVQDALHAAHDLESSEDTSAIVFAGLRFGGTVASLAAERHPHAAAVLLWDDIVDGRRYLQELESLHRGMLADQERFPRRRGASESAPGELLGTRYARRFLEELGNLSLPKAIARPGILRLRMRSGPASSDDAVEMQGGLDHGWHDGHRMEESLVDPDAIRTLVSRLNAALA